MSELTNSVTDPAICNAILQDGILTLSTGRILRRYRWNGGALIGDSLVDLGSDDTWRLGGEKPDLELPGHDEMPHGGKLETKHVPGDLTRTPHLLAVVTVKLGQLEVRRTFRLYPHCPAIACGIEIRGRHAGQWRSVASDTSDRGNIESTAARQRHGFFAPVTERLALHRRHTRLTCVELRDTSDWVNNFVRSESRVPWNQIEMARGNLVLVESLLEPAGVFLLKESPHPGSQVAYPGCDVCFDCHGVRIVGLGLDPQDLTPDEWARGYGTVLGVSRGGEAGLLRALRDYQQRLRVYVPDRDDMVLVNTWGDRSQDERISESFALAELEACARLGVSHLQLDDGWQKGRTVSSEPPLDIWKQDGHWDVHLGRFPRGLEPVIARAEELGVEIALWYAPSRIHSNADWEKDAHRLTELWRTLGVRMFKIDMVEIPDHLADRRFRAMLDRVLEDTGGRVVFNLDATAGRRLGYFDGVRYGPVFLENRYTDWKNYYPHWTLRNLWQLARYVPPQRLQIEWLNTWRNAENYPAGDPLAPASVGFEYAFATTLAAQPLAWFESSHLPEAAFELAPLMAAYCEHQAALHASPILPIGEEPSGSAWSGFQSCGQGTGYLLVYREMNDRADARLKTWLAPGTPITATPVIGHGEQFNAAADEAGCLSFTLAHPVSWCLYQYQVRDAPSAN